MEKRVKRSLALSDEGLTLAEEALKKVAQDNKGVLATLSGKSRATIQSFFTGKPIGVKSFQAICEALKIDWQQVSASASFSEADSREKRTMQPSSADSTIEALVREVRQKIEPLIREKCGKLRVLDMERPVKLGEIDTQVNILEQISGQQGLKLSDLMGETDSKQFERSDLGQVRERRVLAIDAVEQCSKVMILGKPGSGKTTFLKHLAIECIGGWFQQKRVPLFLFLKDFAESDGQPDLFAYIGQNLLEPNDLQQILAAGRGLILLDGLDEVRGADSSRVEEQILKLSQEFPENQIAITCRIAARKYTFEEFVEVEIADFNDEQIAGFSGRWFRSKNDPKNAELFLEKLEEEEPSTRELAANPLLLILLCLVFEDSGGFPSNRAELYDTGVDLLLTQWDAQRKIERDRIYEHLSLRRKEDMLGQIARTTFEADSYFFKQQDLETRIHQYIQNLPHASSDPEALKLDSAAVLKSLEAQHGLLVERARQIYAFSHPIVQEYFTARQIVSSCNPYAKDDPTLQELVGHLTERRWREVFLLSFGILDSADVLLQLMKDSIDELLAGDEKLEKFLSWVNEKSLTLDFPYKPAAVRVFYFSRALFVARVLALDVDLDLARSLDLALDRTLSLDLAVDRDKDLDQDLDPDLGLDLALARALDRALDLPFDRAFNLDFSFDFTLNFAQDLARALARALDFVQDLNPELSRELQQLETELPNSDGDNGALKQWWQTQGQAWGEQLRAITIKHRNIGHDWQFDDKQKELLERYYYANKLLVDCWHSDCYVSREVQQEIEKSLLLPISG